MFAITWELCKEHAAGMVQWESIYLAHMRHCAVPQHCRHKQNSADVCLSPTRPVLGRTILKSPPTPLLPRGLTVHLGWN